jgi:DNA-binding beta-propeller fold protein YncE
MPAGPLFVAIDAFTNNVYVTDVNNATVSVIDGNVCNATITFGCRLVPRTLPAGNYPASIAVDGAAGTSYVSSMFGTSVVPLLP